MQEIRKIIKIITNRADKNGFGLDLDVVTEYPSLEEQLYLGARDGLFLTDEDAAKGLYDSDPTDHRFRMLKSRLKAKIMNLLPLVDFKESEDNIAWQYEHESENHLSRAKTLLRSAEYDMAEKQLNKAYAISKECEFTNISYEALRLLRLVYSERCKPTDYYATVEAIEEVVKTMEIEEKAENLFSMISMNLRKSLHSKRNTIDEAGKAVKTLEGMAKKTDSFIVYDRYYRLKMFYCELTGDFQTIVEMTDDMAQRLENGEVNAIRFDTRYNYFMKTFALLRLKQYDEGLKTASHGMLHFNRSTNNWFSHMENYMLLALHSKSYKLASDLMQRVVRNPHLESLSTRAQDRWKLFGAYLNFLIPGEKVSKAINFDEFFVTMSKDRKDKRGYNTSVLILELLAHLQEGNVDRVVDRVDGLLEYMKLHYSDPGQYAREKQFIKIIKCIPSTGYDAKKAEKKGKKYYDKLKELEELEGVFAEIEVLPFQNVWEHIIELMKQGQGKV
ncbi:MAG: hypothetical protein RIF33_03170 [Cyclobacteriaceae bacterium]